MRVMGEVQAGGSCPTLHRTCCTLSGLFGGGVQAQELKVLTDQPILAGSAQDHAEGAASMA